MDTRKNVGTLTTTLTVDKIMDTTIYDNGTYPNSSDSTMLRIGVLEDGTVARSLIKFELPTIPTGYKMVKATLCLPSHPNITDLGGINTDRKVQVYALNQSWEESSANWSNTSSAFEDHVYDYFIGSNSTSGPEVNTIVMNEANVTELVEKWYNGSLANNGILLKWDIEESYNDGDCLVLLSKDAYGQTQDTDLLPKIVITYRQYNGLEDYLSYTSQSHYYGSSHVNNYTGNMTTLFNVGHTIGGALPVALSFVYNTNDVVEQKDYGYGLGIKPNLYQIIEEITVDDETILKLTDEDGTAHFFSKIGDVFNDEDGLSLTIKKVDEDYLLTDKSTNKNKFVKHGELYYLEEIENTQGQKIQIIYTDNKITKAIDNSGNELTISYENNKIVVSSPNLETTINYTNNKLTSITSLGDTLTVSYNANNLIEKITNPDGMATKYEYTSELYSKVSKVSEISKLGNVGNYLNFIYSTSSTKIVDKKGRSSNYIFNEYGNVIGITSFDEDHNLKKAYGKSYSFGSEEDGNVNRLVADKSLIQYVNNLLIDSSFELEQDEFEVSGSLTKSYIDDSRSGAKALKITSSNSNSYIYLDKEVTKGENYTFSCYLKNDVPVTLELSYDDVTELVNITKLNTEYNRYEVSINYPETATSNLRISLKPNNSGNVIIDDIQLEASEVANYYNLVDNSSFDRGLDTWMTTNTEVSDASISVVDIDNQKAVKMHSDPLDTVQLIKHFNVSGKAGDTFNLSFWYKNFGIQPAGYMGLYNGVFATVFFYYGDDYLDGAGIPVEVLNVGSDEWQFLSTNFTAEADYSNLAIRITSPNNANDCYLTNFALFKDLEQYSYVYDENGNLISATDLNKESNQMNYDSNNQLVKMLNPTGANYTFEYDNDVTDRVVRATTASGVSNEVKYDSFGNPISTKITNKNIFGTIDSNTTYHIRAKGLNKYFYINPDKSIRIRENECSYDKFKITKIDDSIKIEHAILNNYYLKEVDGAFVLNYGDNDNLFKIYQNTNMSYSIVKETIDGEDLIRKAVTIGDNLKLSLSDYTGDTNQQFFFEQTSCKLFIESNVEYTDDGRFTTKEIDELGNETTYDIDTTNGLTNKVIDANLTEVNYEYDDKRRVKKISKDNHEVSYEYEDNNMSKIIHGTKNYQFTYDEYNNVTNVKINNNTLVTNHYEEGNGNLNKVTYGNNNEVSYSYDKHDRIDKVTKMNDTYDFKYDNFGRLTKYVSNNNTYDYKYDFAKRLSTYNHNGMEINYDYTKNNSLFNVTESLGTNEHTYSYEYNNENAVTKITNDNETYNFYYDKLGRLEERNINNDLTIKYKYITNGNRTSTTIDEVDDNGTLYKYVHDKLGNITEVYKNNVLVNKYYYDVHSQLVKEDNITNNYTIVYTYDNYGNILSIKKYTYRTETLIDEHTYTYGNSNWQDQLTKYDNESITYDAIGNPLTIGDKTFTWRNGRELASYSDTNNNVSYIYNNNGIRTSKTVNNVTINYYLKGNKIVFEEKNNTVLYFIYNNDELVGFKYNGSTYHYHKNLFGDVIGIYDSNINDIVTYEYDSWGTIVNTIDNSNINLSTINPFRYRSYYYDEETKLYYLNSRYYNPKFGRFVNADNQVLGIGGSPLGYNLYGYCFNNPINLDDDQGKWPKWTKKFVRVAAVVAVVAVVATVTVATGGTAAPLIGAATGAVISGTVSAAAQLVTTGEINPDVVLVDACVGAISGAIGVTNLGFGTSLAINAGLNGLGYVGTQAVTDSKVDVGELAISMGSAAVSEGVGQNTIGNLSDDVSSYILHAKKINVEYKINRTSTKTAIKNIKYHNYKKLEIINRYNYNFSVNVVSEVAGAYYNQLPTFVNNVLKLFE